MTLRRLHQTADDDRFAGAETRDRVAFASYLFFRYPDPATGRGEVPRPLHRRHHASAPTHSMFAPSDTRFSTNLGCARRIGVPL